MTGSPSAFDAIVVGLGAHGSAAARALAGRGLRVLGLEAGERGHEHGSSGGRTRMIRRAYFEDPAYVPLLHEARAGWEQLGAARGEPMIEVTGGLYAGGPTSGIVDGSVASARAQGLDHEVLDAAEIHARWPLFELASELKGLWDPGAGLIRPDRAIAALLALAEADGGELRFGQRVVDWRPAAGRGNGGGFEVETSDGVERAAHLVIAAGAWTPGLVPDLGLPVDVERVPVFWFEPVTDGGMALDRLPVWIVDTDDGAFYGFARDPELGLKVARHHSGDFVADPSAVDRSERPGDVERVRRFMAGAMPAANGRLRHAIVCLYANTPDLHFVVDTHPAIEGMAFASACSGHGFKFAPVVGEILADLVLTGSTSRDISRFRAARFAG